MTLNVNILSSISTIAQCTEELVHNALDSGSSCIAIRVDMSQLKVQVIDNGDGISKNDMERVCSRFMTSKCHSLKDLEQGGLCKYGYRGEALANIREMSSILQIVSRKRQEKETWTVLFSRGKRKPVKLFYETRQCCGTTVTVVDFMYNLPVRRRMINPTLELQDMIQSVIGICLVNPDTSFTFLNENTGKKLLQTLKQNSSIQLFPVIFGKEWKDALLEIKKASDKLSLHGFIGKKGVMNSDKQFIYVNRRPIRSTKLLKIVTSQLKKSIICRQPPSNDNKQRAAQNYYNSPFKYAKLYPIFCIEIELPFFDYDISFGPRKNEVEFQDWEYVTKFIICSVNEFLFTNNLLPPSANMQEKERQKRDNEKVAYLPPENVDKFSMTGIEPLNSTMETQQSNVPEAMSNENSLIRTDLTAKLSEKVDKSKRTINANEIDGARQCRPVFKSQKRGPGKILSESKIIQSSLPYSSSPNPSLQYP
jgi:DNA mismatch repair protein MLH3